MPRQYPPIQPRNTVKVAPVGRGKRDNSLRNQKVTARTEANPDSRPFSEKAAKRTRTFTIGERDETGELVFHERAEQEQSRGRQKVERAAEYLATQKMQEDCRAAIMRLNGITAQ